MLAENLASLLGEALVGSRLWLLTLVPSEWIRSRKENRIMIETDGDLLQTSAWIYVGLLSFA